MRGQRADLQIGVAGQQSEQLTARVAAGSRDRNPRAHVPPLFGILFTITHDYAIGAGHQSVPGIGWTRWSGWRDAGRPGWPWLALLARGRTARAAGWLALLAGGAGLLAGCGSPPAAGAGPGASCGTTRTAANVAVIIKVAKGTVDCSTALRVENEYAAKIRAGQVQGNGGGAPVAVSGWTCQGYPTPEVLSTGTASQCHTSRAAIVAVLAARTPGGTTTTG